MYPFTLFKHKDNRSPNFYCLYSHPITGKNVHFSCRSANEHEALKYAHSQLPKLIQKAYQRMSPPALTVDQPSETKYPYEPILLSQFADWYVNTRRNRRGHPLKKKSRTAILHSFSRLMDRISNKYLHEITEDDCHDFIMTDQPSDRTAEKHYDNLRPAFDAAVESKKIKENYFRRFKPPVPYYTDEERDALFFDDTDFNALLDIIPTTTYAQRRLRVALILLHETGLRTGELRHIHHQWYDLNARWLKVKSSKRFSPKTGGSSRIIPLSDNAVAAIRAQLDDNISHERSDGPFLFPNAKGQPVSDATISNLYRKYRKQLPKGTTPHLHGLRHNLVTRLSMDSTLADRMIEEVTGHDSEEMRRRYSHLRLRVLEPIRTAMNNGPIYYPHGAVASPIQNDISKKGVE